MRILKSAGKFIIVALVAVSICFSSSKMDMPVSAEGTSMAEQILVLVNKERAKVGVAPLEMDETLNMAGDIRAEELTEIFSHDRPDGEECFSVLDEVGVGYGYAGENIAAGSSTAGGVMSQWMNSEGHRNNILNENYTHIGIGYCYDPNSKYGSHYVQLFVGDFAAADIPKAKGDIDGNGRLTLTDITMLQSYLLGGCEFDAETANAADCDNSGAINILDLLLIKMAIIKG